jgi:hypothetical protein
MFWTIYIMIRRDIIEDMVKSPFPESRAFSEEIFANRDLQNEETWP